MCDPRPLAQAVASSKAVDAENSAGKFNPLTQALNVTDILSAA
jgi:hypothetical protein